MQRKAETTPKGSVYKIPLSRDGIQGGIILTY